MSRSGYGEGEDQWDLIRYRGQVASAVRGKRGQRMFRELLAALDAMPEKRLVTGELVTDKGEVCALGCLGKARGVDMQGLNPEEPTEVAEAFDIAEQLACEVVYENDEGAWGLEPEARWKYMRAWVERSIKADTA